jgi:hypothetical protein
MSISSGNFAGAADIRAPSSSFFEMALRQKPIEPALRYWLDPGVDESSICEIRKASADCLELVFPGQTRDWLVTTATAVLNGMPLAEVVDLETERWAIDPADERANAARFSMLWLAARDGDNAALGLIARLLLLPLNMPVVDQAAALREVARLASLQAQNIALGVVSPEIDPEQFHLYDADEADQASCSTAIVDLAPPSFGRRNPLSTVICATREMLNGAEEQIRSAFPWMSEAAQTLFRSQSLRVLEGAAPYRFPPSLLIGPSGTAKTSFAYALSESTGVPVFYVSAAGRTGSLEIVGSSRSYEHASPSVGVRAMGQLQCLNPIIIVDEVDKFGLSLHNGDPYGALATMVESHTARAYIDDYLEAPVDLSQISWIFTANAIEPLKGPFLDRLEIIRVQRPTVEHFPAIYSHALREIAREAGIAETSLPSLDPSVIRAIRDSFRTGISLRRVKSAITKSLEIVAERNPN